MIQDINEFIRLANEGNLRSKELQTQIKRNNQDVIGDLFISVSFGMGTAAKVPWIAIGRYAGYKEDGPVFLYYKERNKLILSYGVKEEENNNPQHNFSWSQEIRDNNEPINNHFGGNAEGYGTSYAFKIYDVSNDSLVDGSTVESDLMQMLTVYKNQLSNTDLISFIDINYTDYEQRLAIPIQDSRQQFLKKYPLQDLRGLTIEQYNKLGDTETFANYIERKTDAVCSGFLGTNRNRLFYESNGTFDTINGYKVSYPNKTVLEIFEIFKEKLYRYITDFSMTNYDVSILPGRLNVIKFKSIRLYRKEIKLYGLPSVNNMAILINHLGITDPKNEEVMFYNFLLSDYLNNNYPEVANLNTDIINTLIWEYFNQYVKGGNTIDDNEEIEINYGEVDAMKTKIDKNLILYGPPGTGKTYNSKNYAVAICESKPVEEVMEEDYNAVLERYDEYVKKGHIIFTTFHQSYGYEDFIEGIYPEIDNNTNQVIYKIKNGVFKDFCKAIEFHNAWNTLISDVRNNGLKWGQVLLTAEDDTKDKAITINDNDSIVIPYGGGVPFTRDNAEKFYNGKPIENTQRSALSHIYNYFVNNYLNNPRVFIIDEINRGNISKIFGELITLIEDTKRSGSSESMEVMLPYSKELFSVSGNVYILGTMNTADRSIALMDTALRRRFSFKEMMPEAIKLNGIEVDGLNIESMLEAMNSRIEVLYDREHTIGHAYFMTKSLDLEELSSIFRNKIIPLLQEYFYEDYEKIQWILGDNAKSDDKLKFIKRIKNERSIFKGQDGSIDMSIIPEFRYEINEEAFSNIESYKQII